MGKSEVRMRWINQLKQTNHILLDLNDIKTLTERREGSEFILSHGPIDDNTWELNTVQVCWQDSESYHGVQHSSYEGWKRKRGRSTALNIIPCKQNSLMDESIYISIGRSAMNSYSMREMCWWLEFLLWLWPEHMEPFIVSANPFFSNTNKQRITIV